MTRGSLYLITGPSESALSLAEAKSHLRVDFSDDDALIQTYIDAAIENIDGARGCLGRALVSQIWELRLKCFERAEIRIPLPPLLQVVSVKYYDADDALQTLLTDVYEVIGVGGERTGRIALRAGQSWPSVADRGEAVIIQFRAGYHDVDAVPPTGKLPAEIRAALLLMVGDLYATRETEILGVSMVRSDTVDRLLAGKRVFAFG